jgi:hypothetical protein
MVSCDPAELELLSSARDRAQRLLDTLRRQEAELSSDTTLERAIRETGLQVVRRAVECANQLVSKTEQALLQANFSGPAPQTKGEMR